MTYAGVEVSTIPALRGTLVGDGLQRGTPDPWGHGEQLFRVVAIPLLDRLGSPGRIIRGQQVSGGEQE
jgi:hypothetical protein